eukprot:CAMPEP_0174880602 /NCGR_PEP_ID=MMETSP1114-20130205/83842_1 /TAXON_ID=312471 /ORGANISM="Neobodo designis, Strain CCAP 1951/1" /LENGTH=477 /DNA_ID=CAMNT_0016115995 /DNA_START=125 /DNA_END=1555 /DNA_ORIENTATION=+
MPAPPVPPPAGAGQLQRGSRGNPAGALDAQAQIAQTLSSGPRALPQHVSNGIATLASRMAADDVLLSRLRFVVATESLGIASSSSQPRAIEGRPARHGIADPASPASPTAAAGWDVVASSDGAASASGGAVPQPVDPAPAGAAEEAEAEERAVAELRQGRGAAAMDPAPAGAAEEAEAEERAVAELRQVFSRGAFIRTADSSSSVVDVSSASTGAARSHTDPTPATPPGATTPPAQPSSGSGPVLVQQPTTTAAAAAAASRHVRLPVPAETSHVGRAGAGGGGHSRTSSERPRSPSSPSSGDPILGFDPEALMVSARFMHTEHPSAYATAAAHHRTPLSGHDDAATLPSEASSHGFPSPQRDASVTHHDWDLDGAGADDGQPEAGAVAGLWHAIYSSLFVPVDAADPAAHADEDADAVTPARQRVPPPQPAQAQLQPTDERFLIAAAMLVNSAMLYVLLQRARGGHAGPTASTAVCG